MPLHGASLAQMKELGAKQVSQKRKPGPVNVVMGQPPALRTVRWHRLI